MRELFVDINRAPELRSSLSSQLTLVKENKVDAAG